MNFNESFINGKLINIHTAFIGRVIAVNENIARVQPLTYSKNASGELKEQTPVAVYIPQNIKVKQETITYMTGADSSETKTVIVPDSVTVGDVVYCGVSERYITTENLNGKIAKPTRNHDINDSIILAVI